MQNKNLFKDLCKLLGSEKVLGSRSERIAYSRDMSVYSAVPDAVILPGSLEDIQKVVKFAFNEKIPITPRGAGTSVTGAVIPVKGGIVIDLSAMNKIKVINLKDRYIVTEPGAVCANLNRAIAPDFFFPPDPGSINIATIGGMISTNASGGNALKYGTTKDYVLGVEAVLGNGEVIRTGHKTPKASVGFDLTHLFISAEGTNGIITEATLRVCHKPKAVGTCLAGFTSIETAARAAVEITSNSFSLSSCELMDFISTKEFGNGMGFDFNDTEGMLLIEVDGYPLSVSCQIEDVEKICKSYGAIFLNSFSEISKRKKVWHLRRQLISSISKAEAKSRLIPMAEDIGVPVSKIPEAVACAKALSQKYEIPIVLFGHAGDGNIHTTFVLDPLDVNKWEKARLFAEELTDFAIKIGGTISAEHGIGLSKLPFIKKELGETHALMKNLKQFLDPHDIMNPGKMGFSEETLNLVKNFAFCASSYNLNRIPGIENSFKDNGSLFCMMCGSCRLVCPAFAATGLESDNARGKIELTYAVQTDTVKLSKMTAKRFYRCTGCAACEQNCPSEIKVTSLIHKVRENICKNGILPEPIEKHLITLNIKRQSSSRIVHRSQTEVLVFPGCSNISDNQIISSMVKVLDTAKIDYTLLDQQGICCGFPYLKAGDEKGFKASAGYFAESVMAYTPNLVITPCPQCLKMFRVKYPEFSLDLNVHAQSLAEYVNHLIGVKKLPFNSIVDKKIIYHDPCYLSRHLGIINEPREVLQKIHGVNLLEFPINKERTICCGGGDWMSTIAPEIAGKIALIRLKQALESGCQIIATACPSCKEQFIKNISKFPSKENSIQVMDIIEIVNMAM